MDSKMACEPNRLRLLCMLSLTTFFFVVEVVVSRITSSLAMLSDSFHMLSDVIALIVALVAVRFAEKTQATNKNTFGWIRAEVMGALVNAVFLTALCFTIVLEAIERFTEPHEIENPVMVIIVGAVGLVVNLFGLCMFHGSAGGGGHGHSHGGGGGGHGHSHTTKGKKNKHKADHPIGNSCIADKEETNNLVNSYISPNGVNLEKPEVCDLKDNFTELHLNGTIVNEEPFSDAALSEDSTTQLNMRGVFLHVLGDALGSVIVVVNATVFYFVWRPCSGGSCINPCLDGTCPSHKSVDHNLTDMSVNSTEEMQPKEAGPCWVLYLDPTLCIIMVCILLYTTYPLLKESALILLQTVPKQIDIRSLNQKLRCLDGVEAVHELHVWQLAGSRIIATAHIKCRDPAVYMDVAKRIKDFFHNEGIHATTIQPEFAQVGSESTVSLCELSCRTQCAQKLCCGNADKVSSEKKLEKMSSAAPSLDIIDESPENKAMGIEKVQDKAVVRIDLDCETDKQFESSL
ncbi:zinc transporter 1 [Protopterus annectens]|uniref:zinc transporter 1 n=1 Tax=Protopterus annectens TaxID=7888 RepID=UPI001CFB44AD|nr:zinc transporter 1 [Protopterus annectens]